jgi:fructokinase
MTNHRIGIDLGGTKIEIVVLAPDGAEALRHRIPTPLAYQETLDALAALVRDAETQLGVTATVGIGIPGVISPTTGRVKNANSIALNGHTLDLDLSALLGREIRVENDANCFALSEANDGAGAGHGVVFGVILGTGCGGGIVYQGRVHRGPNRVAGEWGHMPRPSLARDCDGPGARDASGIPGRAAAGDVKAQQALARHADRLARGLTQVINLLDPDIIVLGGGLSNMDHLYTAIPARLGRYGFSDVVTTRIVKNKHGDSSGVRGAAWLWPAA